MRHLQKPLLCLLTFLAFPSFASSPDKAKSEHKETPNYSPHAAKDFPTRPFFGDLHLHTSYSMDAGTFGARIGPRDAYAFGKGQELVSATGQKVKLARPLDFIAVTDHSDYLGFFPDLFAGKESVLADPTGKRWYDMVRSGKGEAAALEIITAFSTGKWPEGLKYTPGTAAFRSAWSDIIKAADEANDPGRFTAFIGFEWTSNTSGNNLHRNVLFRGNATMAGKVEPFITIKPLGSDNPRDLWAWMADAEAKTGSPLLAIAHNGNLSNGRMFPIVESFTGKPIDRDYALARARWEPLYEATQIKGDGETHPFLSPNDEFAGFEIWDKGNLELSVAKSKDMLEFEYVRSALLNGLKLERELGVNPYKFGLIGSTDAHTGLPAVDEDNFFGKHAGAEPSSDRATHIFMKGSSGQSIVGWEQTAGGYAAVWATANTRESLFDAMQRRETYATTGPRMVVRLFGGWNYQETDIKERMIAKTGYAKGVPMGGDLSKAPKDGAPTFLVGALKDPIGANLDRYQIVKGWLDPQGKLHERVYDVVWAGNRKVDAKSGKVPDIGSTVDVANATWTNTIGASELLGFWRDPDFDAKQRAFYYGRVIEIPTPRWTAYDAKRLGITLPKEVPMSVRERAYTSPIWYTPG